MPRPPSIIRPRLLHTSLPEDLLAKLDLVLFSEVEQRVPKGAYQSFLIDRIQEFLTNRRLGLEQFGAPPGYSVKAAPEILDWLNNHLKGIPK